MDSQFLADGGTLGWQSAIVSATAPHPPGPVGAAAPATPAAATLIGGPLSSALVSGAAPPMAALPMNTVSPVGDVAPSQLAECVEHAQQRIANAVTLYTSKNEDAICKCLIDETAFLKFIKAQPVKAREAQFRQQGRTIGRPAEGFQFPEQVTYPHHCRVVCEKNVKAHERALHILAMLGACASRCGPPSQVPVADMMILADAIAPVSAQQVQSCWLLVAASGRSGHHLATQTWMRCLPPRGETAVGYPGQRLTIERSEKADMLDPIPQFASQSAAPAFYDEEAVASYLLGCGAAREELLLGEEPVPEVVFRKLFFEEQADSTFIIVGMDTSWEVLRATSMAPKKEKKASTMKSAAPSAGFFELLLDEEAPKPKPKPASAAKRTGDKPLPSASGELGDHTPSGDTAPMRELASELGLVAGPIEDDPWGDAAFLEGLREVVGDEAIEIFSRARADLEENDEAAQEAADKTDKTMDAEVSEAHEVAAATAAPAPVQQAPEPQTIVPASATAAPGARTVIMHGLTAQFTGFTSGVICYLFELKESGAASSSGASSSSASTHGKTRWGGPQNQRPSLEDDLRISQELCVLAHISGQKPR